MIKKKYKTVEAFAQNIGRTPDSIRKILRGDRRPNPETLQLLLDSGISLKMIYGIPLRQKPKRKS